MTIKALAHSAQLRIHSVTGIAIKRTHLYELLASSFGYRSYAALCAECAFTRRREVASIFDQHRSILQQRCIDLGYGPIAAVIVSTLPALLGEYRIGVIKLNELVAILKSSSNAEKIAAWDQDDAHEKNSNDLDEDEHAAEATNRTKRTLQIEALASSAKEGDTLAINALRLLRRYEAGEPPAILLDSLHSAASKGNALAHYALALIHESYYGSERAKAEFTDARQPPFKAFPGAAGRKIATQWQDEIAQESTRTEKYIAHLRTAAQLGNAAARLELADHLGDANYLDAIDNTNEDPLKIAEIAHRLGRDDEAKSVLTTAAESGNLDAMRYLVDVYDRENATRYRMWFYLARLLGSDLSPSDKYILHRLHDSSWFGAGEKLDDGIEPSLNLLGIDHEDDHEARRMAQELFERIDRDRLASA